MPYEPTIKVMIGQLETQIENDIITAILRVGVDVDKDELLRALRYDRDQYRKGYDDAKVHAHWIIFKGGQWAECSRCHEDEKIAVLVHKDYCPACGAIMDEEVERRYLL